MRGRLWPWLLLVLALVPALLVRPAKPPLGGLPPTENVTLAVFGNPKTLDPALASSPSEWAVDSNIFEPLFMERSSGALNNDLVQSYSVKGRVLTLTLKPAHLANGASLTAAAVAGALARPLWPKVHSAQAAALLAPVVGARLVYQGKAQYISGVSDVNANTVTIQLKHPVSRAFIQALANPTLSIVPPADLVRGGADWQEANLYGTGGFRLTNWIPDGSLSFERISGSGPAELELQIFTDLRPAVLAFQNGTVSAVPLNPQKMGVVPNRLVRDVRSLTVPGNLYLVYRRGALRVSAYPRLTIHRWVSQSFRGRIPALPGQWPSGIRTGKPMTIYVNRALPQAVQLADTLARLEPGRVTVDAITSTALTTLARHNQINAYIGRANLFKSGITVPVAPLRALWLVSPAIPNPTGFANGTLDWHSLSVRK